MAIAIDNKLLLIEMFKLLNVDLTIIDIFQVEVDFETFQNDHIIDKIHALIPTYKTKYKSNMLTCLHTNSLDKQAFPAINFVRQILKCNNMKLKGRYLNLGNNKTTGQKILKRVYSIVPMPSFSESLSPTPPVSDEHDMVIFIRDYVNTIIESAAYSASASACIVTSPAL